MKKLLLFLMLLPSLVSSQNANELMARWGVSGFLVLNQSISYHNNANTSITANNVTAGNVNGSIAWEGFSGNNWPTSQTPDFSKYFQFSVAPLQGKNLAPKMFRFEQSGACRRFQVRYSTSPDFPNNGQLLLEVNNATNVQDQWINVSFPSNLTVASGQTLYIRVYGYYKNSETNWYIRHNGLFSGNRPEFYGVATNSITANPDTATTYAGQPVNINVLNNDVISNTTVSAVSIVSQPSQGSVTVQANNTITYTPGFLTLGNITFQYQITAANGATATATVTVTVSPLVPPVAVNDNVTLLKNTTAQINVLANDTPGTGVISLVSVSGLPLYGTVTVIGNAVQYTPNVNYTGTDSFTYTITDLFNSTATATVNLTINEPALPAPGSNAGIYCSSSTTWNGTQWSNGNPTANKDAIIAANYVQNGGTLTACSLYVTGNAEVVFKNNSNAVITHSVNVNETASLTFESSCNLLQVQNTPNTGNITIRRFGSRLKRLDYTFWSSPVSGGQTLLEFSPATQTDRFYIYNTGQQNFMSVPPATTTFTPARGYLIRMPNAITGPQASAYAAGNYRFAFEGIFTGVPNNGTVQIPLEYYGENGRYNSVGNPYPSPISATAFILANIDNIEGTLWIWRKTNNPHATSYCTLTTLGFIANNALGGGGAGGNDGNDLIADPFSINLGGVLNTGQGFIVRSKTNQPLVFTNSMRRNNNFASFFRNADEGEQSPPEENAVVASRIWLNASNNEDAFAQTLIGYTSLATVDYDNGIDGMLMPGGAINLYSVIAEGNLSIQGRPEFVETDVVQLGFKAQTAGEFTIAIDHVDGLFEGDQQIYLKDNLTGDIHNLKESDYDFSSEAGVFEERFQIVYSPDALSIPNVPNVETNITVYSADKSIGILSDIEIKGIKIFNVAGKQIYAENGINTTHYLSPAFNGAQQMVLLTLELNNGTIVKKKVMLK